MQKDNPSANIFIYADEHNSGRFELRHKMY